MAPILVPTDFSRNASTALKYAIQLCAIMKQELIVFHASQISAYAIAAASTEEQKVELFRDDENNKLEKLHAHVQKAYNHWGISKIPKSTKMLVEYNPMMVERTAELASQQNASLIVMGTHGATGITKFFFGSNTSIMISKSTIPVLAIPEKYSFKKPEEILFASDLENLEIELNQIIPFAQSLKVKLNILYFDYGIDQHDEKLTQAEAIIKKMPYKKIKLLSKKATIEKTLISQLKKFNEREKPDMLVMFTRERSLWDRLIMNPKTEDLSSSIRIPLLSFKKK